ncbi:MAG: sensor histidine kinase [Caulobacteraceae bacterium]
MVIPKLESKNDILLASPVCIPHEYKNELLQELIRINAYREKILSYVLMVVVIGLFCLDTFVSKILGWNRHIFIPFSTIHVLLLLVSLTVIIFDHIKEKHKDWNIVFTKAFHIIVNAIVLVICSLIGIANIMIHQQPYAYIIAMFCIASLIILSPNERRLIYLLPYFIYTTRSIIVLNDISYLIEVIFFSSLLTAVALMVSRINYTAYVKNYIGNKDIQKKNEQLDGLYKITEDMLKKRTSELNETIEYEKLRTDFFANISHELRTPLNVIFSAEQMLRYNLQKNAGLENNKEINQYMHMIKQNSYRLVRLINNLIDITKIDAGYFHVDLKNWDIVKVVEDICISVAKYIEDRDIELTFDTEIEEKVVACDPDKVERIILNLLSNAVKFTQKGGHIYVNIYEESHKIIISVKDTGIGIPAEKKDSVFEKFVQVDKTSTRNREGSGIGLSIVKSLVEMHNGTISLKSEPGMGSEFIIEIPDTVIEEEESIMQEKIYAEGDRHVDKINIEFSDIYY